MLFLLAHVEYVCPLGNDLTQPALLGQPMPLSTWEDVGLFLGSALSEKNRSEF